MRLSQWITGRTRTFVQNVIRLHRLSISFNLTLDLSLSAFCHLYDISHQPIQMSDVRLPPAYWYHCLVYQRTLVYSLVGALPVDHTWWRKVWLKTIQHCIIRKPCNSACKCCNSHSLPLCTEKEFAHWFLSADRIFSRGLRSQNARAKVSRNVSSCLAEYGDVFPMICLRNPSKWPVGLYRKSVHRDQHRQPHSNNSQQQRIVGMRPGLMPNLVCQDAKEGSRENIPKSGQQKWGMGISIWI